MGAEPMYLCRNCGRVTKPGALLVTHQEGPATVYDDVLVETDTCDQCGGDDLIVMTPMFFIPRRSRGR